MPLARRLAAHWPLWVAWLLVLASVAHLVSAVHDVTGGIFVYTLDDPYIHMAIAKNLVRHGVWGVSAEGFTFASSSLIWAPLLAIDFLVRGPNDLTALALNVGCGFIGALVTYAAMRHSGARSAVVFAVTLAVVAFAPFPTLMSTGMEHTLHCAITIALVALLAMELEAPMRDRKHTIAMCVTAALLTATRYEGLFLAALVTLALVLHGRRRLALWVGLCAVAPPALFGLYAASQGWFPLPNSVLLKGARPALSTVEGFLDAIGRRGLDVLFDTRHLLAPVAGALILAARPPWGEPSKSPADRTLLVVFVAAVFLHAQFAQRGNFFRYDAYLVALGVFVLGRTLGKQLGKPSGTESGTGPATENARRSTWWQRRVLATVAAVLVVYPLAERAFRSVMAIPIVAQGIYREQYQMGRFVAQYYPRGSVGAHDIGVIAYLSEARITDYWGLASMEAARARFSSSLNADFLERRARDRKVEIAILKPDAFAGLIPASWREVGRWSYPSPAWGRDVLVSFYATRPQYADPLALQLIQFAAPSGVRLMLNAPPAGTTAGPTAPTAPAN